MLAATSIAVAPNGGRRTRQDHPAIPLSTAEMARTAAECMDAGAAMIHVHVRGDDGGHLLDADAYRQMIAAIRSAVGHKLVVQISSESLGLYAPAEQIAVVRQTRPEAVSLALCELVPDDASEAAFTDLLLWMKREEVLPQIILYEPRDAIRLAGLQRRGVVPWDSMPVLFVLGRYSVGQTSKPADLLPFLAPGVPEFHHWSVCAFGPHETACVTAAALLGGHARVGFENNFHLPDGRIAASNADLVRVVARCAGDAGLALLDAAALRETLRGLGPHGPA